MTEGAANVAMLAMVPVDAAIYRCEYVTQGGVKPGEAWPPGSWRVLVDDVWMPINKAPVPRPGMTEDWTSLLAPYVRGAIRRKQEGKP